MAERSDELCLFDFGACYAALLQQFAKCFYVSICGELLRECQTEVLVYAIHFHQRGRPIRIGVTILDMPCQRTPIEHSYITDVSR